MQIPIEMQVMSKCECHKTLEGLQNCKLRCWKKGQIARGHCGRRDLVFDSLSDLSRASSSVLLLPPRLLHTTCHPQLCHTQLVTHNFVTHNLSHTTCHPQLCHTQLVTHNFVTHNLSPTTLSHTTCHTQLVTHNFVTHNLSPTTLSHTQLVTHTTCHPQLCHTQLFVTHNLSRGRRATWRHPPAFCVAGMALGDMCLRFTWQAWHLVTSTCVVAGVALTAWLALVARLGWDRSPVTPRHGRRGTWRHLPAFHVAVVALTALGWLWWRAWAGISRR